MHWGPQCGSIACAFGSVLGQIWSDGTWHLSSGMQACSRQVFPLSSGTNPDTPLALNRRAPLRIAIRAVYLSSSHHGLGRKREHLLS